MILKQTIDFYDRELSKISMEKIEVDIEIKELKVQREKIASELSKVSRLRDEPHGEIHVRVSSKQTTKAEITVNYLVNQAGWFPKYDIRLDDINQPVTLNYKANVYQNTGIDWDKVKLKFSNGNPNESGVAPKLMTWRVNFQRNIASRGYVKRKEAYPEENLALLEEVVEHDEETNYKSSRKSQSRPKAERVTAATVQNQTTVEFSVDRPYSVKSKNTPLIVDLKQYKIPAVYEYYATPKLDKDAFLIARLVDWEQYNLLEGEANLYFENNYVGNSILNAESLSDTLDVSMGRDKNIVIGRERVEEFTKKRTVGTNKVESRQFKTTIRNKKSQSIRLTLFDQIPIAAISTISVEPKNVTGQLDEVTGMVKWNLEIPATSQKEVSLGYEVKYPKKEKVVLE